MVAPEGDWTRRESAALTAANAGVCELKQQRPYPALPLPSPGDAKARLAAGSVAALWITGFFISISISMFLLYKASQTLPMGTAYAVWTGIGAAGTALIGVLIFKEPADFWRMFFIFTIIKIKNSDVLFIKLMIDLGQLMNGHYQEKML